MSLARVAIVEHLLDNVVAEYVLHQLGQVLQQLIEEQGLLELIRLLQSLLDEPGALLVQGTLYHVVLNVHNGQVLACVHPYLESLHELGAEAALGLLQALRLMLVAQAG